MFDITFNTGDLVYVLFDCTLWRDKDFHANNQKSSISKNQIGIVISYNITKGDDRGLLRHSAYHEALVYFSNKMLGWVEISTIKII